MGAEAISTRLRRQMNVQKMILGSYFELILAAVLVCCAGHQTKGVFGEKTERNPVTSCMTINQVDTTVRCFIKCLNRLEVLYMFSYSKDQSRCMCCVDFSGNDVMSFQWTTYIPRSCRDGYASYNNTDHEICVKFVNIKVPYPEAAAQCQAEGGDLFKVDTQLKYDILTDYLVPVANGTTIDVWIQSEKNGTEWRFHDGSKMPLDSDDVCPRDLNDVSYENRIRVRGSSSFKCMDMTENTNYYFLCENHRHFFVSG